MTRNEIMRSGKYLAIAKELMVMRDLNPTDKLIWGAVVTADHSDDKRRGSFWSTSRIARSTGLSRKTAINSLRTLVQRNLLIREPINNHPRAKIGTRTHLYKAAIPHAPYVAVPRVLAEVPSLLLKPASKLVWSQIVEFLNGDTKCWDSYANIASAVGMSPRSVMRALEPLEEVKAVTVHRRLGGPDGLGLDDYSATNRSNRYFVDMMPRDIAVAFGGSPVTKSTPVAHKFAAERVTGQQPSSNEALASAPVDIASTTAVPDQLPAAAAALLLSKPVSAHFKLPGADVVVLATPNADDDAMMVDYIAEWDDGVEEGADDDDDACPEAWLD